MYEKEFNLAIKRNQRLGLKNTRLITQNESLLTPELTFLIRQIFNDYLFGHPITAISTRCIDVHYDFEKILNEELGIPCVFTLGYVLFKGEKFHYLSEEKLKQLCEQGVTQGGEINIHAWITFGSMEILDLTFWTTYGCVKTDTKVLGKFVMQSGNSKQSLLSYHPMLVGDDFLWKAKILN